MSMSPEKVAILMTCHNRCETTLACLRALDKQTVPFDVYLVDDGSSDNTADSIQKFYPHVNLLEGSGELFWVGGMRLAFAEALKAGHEFYLWLNDDTILEPDALSTLLDTYQSLENTGHARAIVVGSVKDPATGRLTYGGRILEGKWYYKKLVPLEPSQNPLVCDTIQGNIVLIPQVVADKVGNIDSAFIHTFGDLDYGLRAGKSGCSVWVAPGYLGSCSQNTVQGSWVDMQLSVFERLKKAFHPKAFPIGAWTTFVKRYKGPFWFVYWFLPYLRAVVGYRKLSASPSFSEDNS